MNRKAHRAIRVCELFAGVGGFRIGLERASDADIEFRVVFSNQYEPGRRKQHASEVYTARFGEAGHVNADIAEVPVRSIPDHDLLVGGFPCQDYSVASTLRNAKGLLGRKGVLWWQIHRILSEKRRKPAHLLLENVDRLLGSPAGQRGRDFAVMLRSLDELGYAVEWRVVNAADYGAPQRRKRVFILGHRRGTKAWKALKRSIAMEWVTETGPLAQALPCVPFGDGSGSAFSIERSLDALSRDFGKDIRTTPFQNTGFMADGVVFTMRTAAIAADTVNLGAILQPDAQVPASFWIPKAELPKWRYLKGAKREPRTARNGHAYAYSEGSMAFPDQLDRPSRTIITGEGGRAPSRFKHVVRSGARYRRLTPVELERLNQFPDGHTAGATDAWRAFFMGNALVVGIVERIGTALRTWMMP